MMRAYSMVQHPPWCAEAQCDVASWAGTHRSEVRTIDGVRGVVTAQMVQPYSHSEPQLLLSLHVRGTGQQDLLSTDAADQLVDAVATLIGWKALTVASGPEPRGKHNRH